MVDEVKIYNQCKNCGKATLVADYCYNCKPTKEGKEFRELLKRGPEHISFPPPMNRNLVNPNPDIKCGNCSYYKTPFCTFVSSQNVIEKRDPGCLDFHLDRHIRLEKNKPKVRMERHGKR